MNVILSGYGRMGHMIEEELKRQEAGRVIGAVDPEAYASPFEISGQADVLIDFSYPGNQETLLRYARERACPLVIGTTGLDEAQTAAIRETAKQVPIVFSSNFSLGVAALKRAVSLLAGMLLESGFDAEIVETHHRMKADAPSGTAHTLLSLLDPDGRYSHVFGRSGRPGPRGREIGVHAVRGGTEAGEHSVFFLGEDETIELKHSAASRRIVAAGAIRAAKFAVGREAGLYSMDDVLGM